MRGHWLRPVSSHLIHTSPVDEQVRIGLGILAAAWLSPLRLLGLAVLARRREIRVDGPIILVLIHRCIPSLVLFAAVVAGSWAVAIAAFAIAVLTTLTLWFTRWRWPERWERTFEQFGDGAAEEQAARPQTTPSGWLAGTVPRGQGVPVLRRDPETGDWVKVYVPREAHDARA